MRYQIYTRKKAKITGWNKYPIEEAKPKLVIGRVHRVHSITDFCTRTKHSLPGGKGQSSWVPEWKSKITFPLGISHRSELCPHAEHRSGLLSILYHPK